MRKAILAMFEERCKLFQPLRSPLHVQIFLSDSSDGLTKQTRGGIKVRVCNWAKVGTLVARQTARGIQNSRQKEGQKSVARSKHTLETLGKC